MTGTADAVGAALTIVVVNYGSHDLLATNLDWAMRGRPERDGVDVVVVDNYKSPEDSAHMAELAKSAGWELVALPENAGFGVGVNRGAEAAWANGADAILILNPDVRVSPLDVARLHAAVLAEPAALVSPLIMDARGRLWGRLGRVDVRGGRLTTTDSGEGPSWLSGACLVAPRALWLAVGGMDSDYFMYWEDVDLSLRWVRAGGSLRLLEDVVVVHDVGGTQGSGGGKSAMHYYYNSRNRLLFAAKCLSRWDLLWWLLLTPADLRRVVTRGRPSRAAKIRMALPWALRGWAAGVWWLLCNARSGWRRWK
jgi:GT2 family glycosyltransferase